MTMVNVEDLQDLSAVADEYNVPLDRLNTWKFRFKDQAPEPVHKLSRGPLYLKGQWESFFRFLSERGLWSPN